MSGPEFRLTGRFTVDLAPDAAYGLFTPEGERSWAAGWDPVYPAGKAGDAAPGTVFQAFLRSWRDAIAASLGG